MKKSSTRYSNLHYKFCHLFNHHDMTLPSLPSSLLSSPSVRTMLEAIISFLPSEGAGSIGSLEYSKAERQKLAKEVSYVSHHVIIIPISWWELFCHAVLTRTRRVFMLMQFLSLSLHYSFLRYINLMYTFALLPRINAVCRVLLSMLRSDRCSALWPRC